MSVFDGERVVITPSALPKPFLNKDDLVEIDLEGNILRGSRRPSSEWKLHVEIYRRRPDAKAVVHTHDVLPAILAEEIELDLLSESEAYLGGGIAIVPYVEPGTRELAIKTAEALRNKNAAILKRHGVVTIGESLAIAINRIEVIDDLAKATYIKKSLKLWSAIGRGNRRIYWR